MGTYEFFNPLVAVILGWLILNEPLTIETLLGAGFILVSILLVNHPKFNMKEKYFTGNKQKDFKEVA